MKMRILAGLMLASVLALMTGLPLLAVGIPLALFMFGTKGPAGALFTGAAGAAELTVKDLMDS